MCIRVCFDWVHFVVSSSIILQILSLLQKIMAKFLTLQVKVGGSGVGWLVRTIQANVTRLYFSSSQTCAYGRQQSVSYMLWLQHI